MGRKGAGGETFVGKTWIRNSEVQEGAGLPITGPVSGVQEVSSRASATNTCFLSHCISVRHTRIECLEKM